MENSQIPFSFSKPKVLTSTFSAVSRHDDVKLEEGGVVADATLHLVLTLRGGASQC
jgi:hypothetical protein